MCQPERTEPRGIDKWFERLTMGAFLVMVLGAVVWFIWLRQPDQAALEPVYPPAYNWEAIAADGEGNEVYRVLDQGRVCYHYRGHFTCMERR